ncbi:glycosyltransferase family 2 protein [Pseudoalteromonas sp.]|uniref:glycosyltransferase family 2 protein n=1 Tax=Pseudoalteromonas sp. TaxID=53249 RepID=UPI0030020751
MTKLSIIVPVYNAEKYIVESLSSCLVQMNEAIELIVVNDGSKDNSLTLIKTAFAKEIKSGIMKIIDQNNQGVSIARNNGIKLAKGEYIAFFDADDILLEQYISQITYVIDKHAPDIIEYGFCKFKEVRDISAEQGIFVNHEFGLQKTSDVLENVYARSVWYPWLRVFARRFVAQDMFPAGVRFCEDLMAISQLYNNTQNIYIIDKVLYGYRENIDGATFNVKADYFDNLVVFYNSLPTINAKYLDYLKVNLSYILYRCSTGHKINTAIRKEFFGLFFKYLFDKKISYRKKVILLSPKLYESLKYIKGLK